jgi:hypothetical protein
VDRGGGYRHDNGGGEYALVSEDQCRAGTSRTTDGRERCHADGSCITSINSTSRGDDGRDGGGGCSGHDASGDCNPSGKGPGRGDSCCCGIDSCVGENVAARSRNGAPSKSEPGRPLGRSSCWIRVHGANLNQGRVNITGS